MPKIFRRLKPETDVDNTGAPKWTWAVERDGRRVVYVVKQMTRADGKDHLVTVYVPRKTEKFPLSPKRSVFKGKEGTRETPESPSVDGGANGIPPGDVPISTPRGQASSTRTNSIAKDGGEVTPDPFASQAGAWERLAARVGEDLTVPRPDVPDVRTEPGSSKLSGEDLIAGTGGDPVTRWAAEQHDREAALSLPEISRRRDCGHGPAGRGKNS